MNIRPDDKLAMVKNSCSFPEADGSIVELKGAGPTVDGMQTWFHTPDRLGHLWSADRCLRPIRDQPGNEDWVTKARKTLPRPTPVPGPVTINARGEVEQ